MLISAGAVPPHTPIAALEADVQLRHLLDETKDFIDSRDFRSVLRLCLDRAFGVFGGAMQQAFGIDTSEDARFQELSADGELGRRMRLATLFPAVAKQSQLAIHGAPNEYVEVSGASRAIFLLKPRAGLPLTHSTHPTTVPLGCQGIARTIGCDLLVVGQAAMRTSSDR